MDLLSAFQSTLSLQTQHQPQLQHQPHIQLQNSQPDPALFFTWYCEQARDIERSTGSTEEALNLLDSALSRLSQSGTSSNRLARRFITATRNSLLRYRLHLAALVGRLNDGEVGAEGEKAQLLASIRALDWREYERSLGVVKTSGSSSGSSGSGNINISNGIANSNTSNTSNALEPPNVPAFNSPLTTADWTDELTILDAIIEGRLDDAIQVAKQGIPLSVSADQSAWLREYCRVLVDEMRDISDSELRIIPATMITGDEWSAVVEGNQNKCYSQKV